MEKQDTNRWFPPVGRKEFWQGYAYGFFTGILIAALNLLLFLSQQ
jgi:hypothetical protein